MSLFRRPVEKRAIRDLPWGEGVRASGESVTVDRALRLAPVYAAGNLLAGTISGLPLQQYRETGGARARMPKSSLFQQPTARGTLHDWLYKAVISIAYHGNAVGLVVARDGFGFPTSVEWLPHSWVNVQDTNLAGPGSFYDPIWRVLGRPVPTEDIVHVPWFVFPGRVWGLSPISAYASTVNTALAAQDFKNDWFRSGGVPPGTFRNTAKVVEQDQAKIMKARVVEAIRTHEPLVFGNDWEYEPVTVPNVDAEFVDTLRLTATQIAVIYGIPPSMIGGETGDSLTYATVEQNALNLVQFGLMPWFSRLEAAFNQLLPARQYVKFNVDGMLRTDIQTRYATYQIARNIGLNNLDEIRDKEDEAPLPNGEGKDYTPLELAYADVAHAMRMPSESGKAPGPRGPHQGGRAPEPAESNHNPQVVRAVYDPADDEVYRRDVSRLQYGKGSALWKYWTEGEGKAKWIGAVHKWRTLRALLIKEHVPLHMVDGLTTNIISHVLPSYMATTHEKSG